MVEKDVTKDELQDCGVWWGFRDKDGNIDFEKPHFLKEDFTLDEAMSLDSQIQQRRQASAFYGHLLVKLLSSGSIYVYVGSSCGVMLPGDVDDNKIRTDDSKKLRDFRAFSV